MKVIPLEAPSTLLYALGPTVSLLMAKFGVKKLGTAGAMTGTPGRQSFSQSVEACLYVLCPGCAL
ncbi:hypothetical protein DCC26_01080 [Auritidibacter sp. NML120779]|nr:hypothetical protein DCC26_01080 [Auritidibacter sp. NML120779]